jgi:cyclic beta-1,2-glucan synthetase
MEPNRFVFRGSLSEPVLHLPEAETGPDGGAPDLSRELEKLRDHARIESSQWHPVRAKLHFRRADPCRRTIKELIGRVQSRDERLLACFPADERAWLLDNIRVLRAAFRELPKSQKWLSKYPVVENHDGLLQTRVRVVADAFLSATDNSFSVEGLVAFVSGWQDHYKLSMDEIWALKPMLQRLVLESLAAAVAPSLDAKGFHLNAGALASPIPVVVMCLRRIAEADWDAVFEEISPVDEILKQDPIGAYSRMDAQSREMYRKSVAELGKHSGFEETEVAREAIALAAAADERHPFDTRVRDRESHVGFYLIDAGLDVLRRRIGHRTPLGRRLQDAVRGYPDFFYVLGIELAALVIVGLVLGGLPPLTPILASFFFLLIPASQAAVELANAVLTSFLPPRALPKLDFSGGIPDEFKTIVAVPTLLLTEPQVRQLVDDLEVRYLANRDPNLYFALLTDGPDSDQPFDDKESLAELASALITELNERYGSKDDGPFYLLHRHRVYNPSEQVWMGWERKRGKLLDFNSLIRGGMDSFPVKVGNLSRLPEIRFVITLDADTQLPRDSAQKLIGTLAHPLNRAVIHPGTNTVVAGYGILQPRIGISIQSAAQSRLASIYAGQTGFDIYTRAVSDVYQDLYGEGIFTGKGIYEVDVFRQVLEHRFPCNALLSHDLIEGAYTRAALVSDIELIDDYPSQFSAYSRRKHRWVRGDWQIMQWLFPRVPDYEGRMVPNPTSVISRWKIMDNLRRSLLDPALFFLLIAGWFFLPGPPWYWTAATLFFLLLPSYGQRLLAFLRVRSMQQFVDTAKGGARALAKDHFNVLLSLTFLTHQALVMVDAIIRTLVRHRITRRKLLEWETAAQAESGTNKKTPVDIYLACTPWIALALTLALAHFRVTAIPYAAPFLVLWASSRMVARWLSRRRAFESRGVKREHEQFLRTAALETWRYFREHSGPEENWLVPDNIQEEGSLVAHRASPTNIGMLLNSRQAALALGYVTLPEFVRATSGSLETVARLAKFRGHLLNWYDTQTLASLEPEFISTVDSGNVAASLWALAQGCTAMLREPVIGPPLWQGVTDHVVVLRSLHPEAAAPISALIEQLGSDNTKWAGAIGRIQDLAVAAVESLAPAGERIGQEDARWWATELKNRMAAIHELLWAFAPWLLSEAAAVREAAPQTGTAISLATAPVIAANITAALDEQDEITVAGPDGVSQPLQERLAQVPTTARAMEQELRRLAAEAAAFVHQMDFRFLYNRRKKLLAIGYSIPERRVNPSCYDLLASEARTACFIAIAKGDIPQESWFHLGRTQTVYHRRRVLLSWTGTMFEYLMPALWMRTYPGTMIDQSMRSAVECQQIYARSRRIPWGISESGHCQTDAAGCYQYQAFGLPSLALKRLDSGQVVVAPYASFLALATHPYDAIRNLRRIREGGSTGRYGFYEALEFSQVSFGKPRPTIVKSWMAHHQAMILMSITNLLLRSRFQDFFHAEPQVIATELLLHEKVPAALRVEQEPDASKPAVQPAA